MAKFLKYDPTIYYIQATHFRFKEPNMLKVKVWKKIYHTNNNQQRAGMAMLILDKIDFKMKIASRDKEGYL